MFIKLYSQLLLDACVRTLNSLCYKRSYWTECGYMCIIYAAKLDITTYI